MKNAPDSPLAPKPPRDFLLVLVAAVFLGGALMGWLRFAGALRNWPLLLAVGVQPSPIYLLATGLLWGSLFTAAVISLWLRTRWAYVFGILVMSFYSVWAWADRLVFYQSPAAGANRIFLAVLSTAILIWVILSLISIQRSIRRR